MFTAEIVCMDGDAFSDLRRIRDGASRTVQTWAQEVKR
jgi:hypothetical protein